MSNELSLLFYIATFTLAAALMAFGLRKKIRIITWGGLLIPILISGFRYGVGTDYNAYNEMYRILSGLSWTDYASLHMSNFEPGAYVLARLSLFTTNDSRLFFLGFSTLAVVFFYIGVKRYNFSHKYLVFLLFLLTVFPLSMNIARQMAAVSIFFYASSYIIDRKLYNYIFWVVIAACFHKSAILLLPIYFIHLFAQDNRGASNKKIPVRAIIIGGLIFVGIAFILPWIIDTTLSFPMFEKFAKYETSGSESKGNILILQALLLMLVTSFYSYLSKAKYASFVILMCMINIAINIASLQSIHLSRMALYFSAFYPVLLTYPIYASKALAWRFSTILLLVVYAIVYFYVFFYFLNGSEIFPYNFQLGGN